MTQTIEPISGDETMPAPIRIVWGVFQFLLGLALALPGAVFRVFPITSLLGSPLMKLGHQLSFQGGANIGKGIVGLFRMDNSKNPPNTKL